MINFKQHFSCESLKVELTKQITKTLENLQACFSVAFIIKLKNIFTFCE